MQDRGLEDTFSFVYDCDEYMMNWQVIGMFDGSIKLPVVEVVQVYGLIQ